MQNSNLHLHQTQKDYTGYFCSVQITEHNCTSISIIHSSWHMVKNSNYKVPSKYDT